MHRGWLGLAWALPGCVVVEHEEALEDTVLDAPIRAVVADIGAGSLILDAGSGDEAIVSRDLRWTGEAPEPRLEVDGDVLRLSVQCRGLQRVCAVDYRIALPEQVTLDASVGSGTLDAAGLDGQVWIDAGSGAVTLTDVAGETHLSGGSGAVVLSDIVGDLTVDVGSGSVDLTGGNLRTADVSAGSGELSLQLVEAPDDVALETGSGSVVLEVPAGTYRVDAHTRSGTLKIDGITADTRADRTLGVDCGSGDITIRGR